MGKYYTCIILLFCFLCSNIDSGGALECHQCRNVVYQSTINSAQDDCFLMDRTGAPSTRQFCGRGEYCVAYVIYAHNRTYPYVRQENQFAVYKAIFRQCAEYGETCDTFHERIRAEEMVNLEGEYSCKFCHEDMCNSSINLQSLSYMSFFVVLSVCRYIF